MEKNNHKHEAEHEDQLENTQSVNDSEEQRETEANLPQEHDENQNSPPTDVAEEGPQDENPLPLELTDDTLQSELKAAIETAKRQPRSSESEEEELLAIPDVLPVLPLKDTVVYPFSVQPLAVGQERSIRLIDDVMRSDRRLVVLVAQKSADIEQAGPDDIFKMGTVSRVGRMFRMPDGTIQIAVQGLERVVIGEF
ncbi:MAG TPA: LON peptidase substrate-binding domain-containing protein, partial [Ktedonobacteraceae bacterium]|nr:LON peptidase substrate-binding domain-containing protein [Ktedonobacteraceae bacterium]